MTLCLVLLKNKKKWPASLYLLQVTGKKTYSSSYPKNVSDELKLQMYFH